MKRFLTLCLMVLAVLCTLTSCCGEEEADLVFVNACDGAVVAVLADFEDHIVGARRAVGGFVVLPPAWVGAGGGGGGYLSEQLGGAGGAPRAPVKRRESFGFSAGEYPVILAVYSVSPEGGEGEKLAQISLLEAPPEGERWYVTAWEKETGVLLSAQFER